MPIGQWERGGVREVRAKPTLCGVAALAIGAKTCGRVVGGSCRLILIQVATHARG